MKKLLFFSLIISFLFFSCSVISSKKDGLTDEKVENYIKVYKELRENAPGMLENINKDPENADIGKQEYVKFVKIIKDGGFKDFKDFIYTNAKIGSIFSILQAQKGMNVSENMQGSGNDMFADGIAEIQKQIDNPDVPEDTKEELIVQIEEMKQQQALMNETYEKNEKIAKIVLKSVKKISGLIVSEKDIEIIEKYEDQIMEAYVGFQLPELPDGKFPDVDFSIEP